MADIWLRPMTDREVQTLIVALEVLRQTDAGVVIPVRESLAITEIESDDAIAGLVDELAGATVQIASVRS